jgi:hypothetical protein
VQKKKEILERTSQPSYLLDPAMVATVEWLSRHEKTKIN